MAPHARDRRAMASSMACSSGTPAAQALRGRGGSSPVLQGHLSEEPSVDIRIDHQVMDAVTGALPQVAKRGTQHMANL